MEVIFEKLNLVFLTLAIMLGKEAFGAKYFSTTFALWRDSIHYFQDSCLALFVGAES
jgi:hypothetical protein